MKDQLSTYSQFCPMNLDQVTRVFQMIDDHAEFSGIITTINQDRETYPLAMAQQIPEDKFLVTFQIPVEGIPMHKFYGEFSKALQPPESTVTVRGERGS